MNLVLTERYHELKPFQRKSLRDRLSDSPKAILLLDFLETHPHGKFGMKDVVDTIYPEREVSFAIRQNRFFKLRKKIAALLQSPEPERQANTELLPLELELYQCREDINANRFGLARKRLLAFVKACKHQNVFELLPAALNHLIYCNLALSRIEEADQLCDDLEEATQLLFDLHRMQLLNRRLYQKAFYSDPNFRTDVLTQTAAIARRHKYWPRFRMYHLFIAMSNGAKSTNMDVRAMRRLVGQLEKMLVDHPDIACGAYEKYQHELVRFYMVVSKGTCLYAQGDAEGCYQCFSEAWSIVEKSPGIRVRKSESVLSNKVFVETATGRYHDAIRTAEDLIEFQKQQKDEDRRMHGYLVLAMVYTYCFKTIPCPNPAFLLDRMDDYARALKKSNSLFLPHLIATKIVFLFMLRRFSEANKLMQKSDGKVFALYGAEEYVDLLKLSRTSSPKAIQTVRDAFEKKLRQQIASDQRSNYQRAMDLLSLLDDQSIKKSFSLHLLLSKAINSRA